ncbi:MAG TPA: hypothetical protein VHE55_17745 [Fimbriimonadaceae bacterium]|nr:hypothetical protein [Fimbriimonadaceae bacterium]
MLATLALSFALIASPPQNTGSALVSKMLKYYSAAKTMTGTITYTATDGAGKVELVTTLQYERPSKLYIRQTKDKPHPLQWLVLSDGDKFSYGHNPDTFDVQRDRLTEAVRQVGMSYDIGSIYAIAAPEGLGDRSVPLDVAIGRHEDLQHDVLMWMTVNLEGKTTVNGVTANLIKGKWRPYGEAATDPNEAPGRYEMVIGDDGRLLRYTVMRWIARDPKNPTDAVDLRENWDVDLTVNGTPTESLFKGK